MTTDAAQPAPGAQSLQSHKLSFTIFPNNLAQTKRQVSLTLPALADHIRETVADRKDKLPLLKLAEFGDVPTPKKCLRHNANMGAISGIEVEHDAGLLSYKTAVKTLQANNLRALIYTTPSHQPVALEKWRILLPTSQPLDKTRRAQLVGAVNAAFTGNLSRESFALSQAFYYGQVAGGSALQLRVIDGAFVDQAGLPLPLFPAPAPGVAVARIGGTSHSLADLDAMLEEYRRTGEGWHNAMLAVTASLVARNWTEEAIRAKCGPYCWQGPDDPDLTVLLDGARAKFGRKAAPVALGRALGLVKPAEDITALEPVKAPQRPADDAPMAAKVKWLVATHGWEETEGRVVKLYATSARCRLRLADFRESFQAWFEVQLGPRGGQNRVLAVAGWSTASDRVAIAGVRMAPDRPFPLFEDDGQVFKNTYQRPRHEGAGDVSAFLSFIERLIPDPDQSGYLLDWMAFKLRRPEIPGCAIMFVADNDMETEGAREGSFGTGRGILFSIARALYGRHYTAEQDFRIIDGSSGQSIYTDWLHNNLLVTVDESPSSPTHYRQGERAIAYETLKRVIDPAPTTRTFNAKYQQAFTGTCHCSLWIATNHYDALSLPAEDRRITVLRNGRPMVAEDITAIIDWRDSPGSLAALQAFLEARDITAFNAFAPLATEAKARMVEANRTEIENAFLELAEDGTRGLVFTRQDLHNAVRALNQGEMVSGHFEHAWRRWIAVSVRPGGGSHRIRVAGTQRKLFCFRRNARKVAMLSDDMVREHALRWQGVIRGLSGLGSHPGSQEDD